jgi:fluoride exporter
VVNLTGSFLLGIYLARRERAVAAESSISFWAIGVLGSFTTFSAFSVDVVNLLDAGRSLVAGGYVAVSVLGGLAIALLGDRLGSVMR